MWFSWKLSSLELLRLLTTYRAFQRTYHWSPKIQDVWDPPSSKSTWHHFFLLGWSDLDIISQTGAEWHFHCDDMAKLKTRFRIPIWRTLGRIPWHVIPEPPATLLGAATWRIKYHDSRATCHIAGCCHLMNSLSWFQSHIAVYSHLAKSVWWSYHVAGCKNSIRRIENRFSPHVIF